MRVRYWSTRAGEWIYGRSNSFNVHALAEVIVYFDEDEDGGAGGCDSMPCNELEVFVSKRGEWLSFRAARMGRDVITDNANTRFFEPENALDRERGFTLA